MADDLLSFYNRELAYIRREAGAFAEQNPSAAGRLRLSADATDDPFVARLIEAVAYLNARIRLKLDDDFPELTDALLGVLYPHYLAPIPSMAIAQMGCLPELTTGYTVDAGAEIETEAVGGEVCRFRTGYPVTLWPVAVAQASLSGRPLVAPVNQRTPGAAGVLRLTLRCLAPEMTFTKLAPDRLRFFLRGAVQQMLPLYELIFNNVLSVALADGYNDPHPVILDRDCIRPVGFDLADGLLPSPPRSHPAYRLLTEYFCFPEKFLFFDLVGLDAKLLLDAGNKLDVFLYVDRTSLDLERSVTTETFALGCTPIVNLFRQRAEPIALTQSVAEYRVVPDARRPTATEVYSIDRVLGTTPDGSEIEILPFYALKHADAARAQANFWNPARRPAAPPVGGSEVWLSLVDLDFDPAVPQQWTLSVDTTCLNRDLPGRLPYGGGRPQLDMIDPAAAVTGLALLTPPTATVRPPSGHSARWRLISHLTLNHLSLVEGGEGVNALREILKLYDFRDSAETRAAIDGIIEVASRRGSARVAGESISGICRGVEVTISFDEQRYVASGLFLLAAVLDRVLGLYCSINSFTRLTAAIRGRPGIVRRWPPRAGELTLL